MTADFLQSMAAGSRERARLARQQCSPEQMLLRAYQRPVSPLPNRALRFDLIAEVKLRSPAVGHLKPATENIGARVTGYAPHELLLNGRLSYEELTHPEDRERVRREINGALAEGRRFGLEYRILHADGKPGIVHHGEHAGEAPVLLADQPADRAGCSAFEPVAIDHGAGR